MHRPLCTVHYAQPTMQGGSKALFRVNNAKLMLNRHRVLMIIIIIFTIKLVFDILHQNHQAFAFGHKGNIFNKKVEG